MGYLEDRLSNIDRVPDTFNFTVDSTREPLFRELRRILLTFEIEGGNLVLSSANLARIEEIIQSMGNFLFASESEYLKSLQEYLNAFAAQATLANGYFSAVEGFNANNPLYTAVLKKQQFNTARIFSREALEQQIGSTIRAQITSQVTATGSLDTAVQALQDIVVGTDERLGQLSQYSRVWADTSFASADRQYVKAVADDLGLERWQYSGSLVKDSRQFCVDRVGFDFSSAEVQSWANLDWQGKIAGTNEDNIFELLGGWNCRHVLQPVL